MRAFEIERLPADVPIAGETLRVVVQVVVCAEAWREAVCFDTQSCFGDNHLEACPVEFARQDLLAALNKFEMHR